MASTHRTHLASISREAWRLIDKLLLPAANLPPPVDLEPIARLLGIRNIRFKPLLSDAGLALADGGYDIIVNTEAARALPDGTVLAAGNGAWSSLAEGLRFRIAHELGHIAFLKAAGGDRNDDLFTTDEQEVEKACNCLARNLLLPRLGLIRELGDHLLNLEHVQTVINGFQVAAEVFILRFKLADVRSYFAGENAILAYVHAPDGTPRLRTCQIWGGIARERFDIAYRRTPGLESGLKIPKKLSPEYSEQHWVLEGHPVNDLKLGIDLEALMRDNRSGKEDVTVE